MNKVIYLDMDGVLVDFLKGIDLIGIKREDLLHSTEKEIKAIWENENFWANLDWTKDGKELVKYVKKNYTNIFILTSPSRMTNKSVIKGKLKWIKKELPFLLNKTLFAVDKFRLATKEGVLIDDTIGKVAPWIEAGGIGILHKNTEDTIRQLKEL